MLSFLAKYTYKLIWPNRMQKMMFLVIYFIVCTMDKNPNLKLRLVVKQSEKSEANTTNI